jgi:hypothetical protein
MSINGECIIALCLAPYALCHCEISKGVWLDEDFYNVYLILALLVCGK